MTQFWPRADEETKISWKCMIPDVNPSGKSSDMDIPWGAQGKWYLHCRWVFNIILNVLQATVISAIYAELQTNTSMAGLSVVRLFEPSERTFSGIWNANLCTSETLTFCLLLGNSWYWVWFESLKHHQCLSNILQSTRRIKLPKRTSLRVAPETVEAGRDSVGSGFSCVQQCSIYNYNNYIHGFIRFYCFFILT